MPINCTYLLPELATETDRTDALRCLAQYSPNRFAVIGYDMVPITVPETCAPGNAGRVRPQPGGRPLRRRGRDDLRGGRHRVPRVGRMLPGSGSPGRGSSPACCPTRSAESTRAELAAAADRLLVGGLPMVLVVGSHEPRKNHLAILHAAELLWREGLRFSLTFIGGSSWGSEQFAERLAGAAGAGRPIEAISAAGDDLLWSAYRLARFTVFPSLNEGFGLPVVESIACGTPVITSDFGSMREIAAQRRCAAGRSARRPRPGRRDARAADRRRRARTGCDARPRRVRCAPGTPTPRRCGTC